MGVVTSNYGWGFPFPLKVVFFLGVTSISILSPERKDCKQMRFHPGPGFKIQHSRLEKRLQGELNLQF